jgi:hypothetical protein
MVKYRNANGFDIVRLHYSADPEKNQEWMVKAKAAYPYDELWEQEMELSFTSTQGKRVYPEFRIDNNVIQLKHDPYRPIWRGWDFGYHHPVCVWAQVTKEGTLNVLGELIGEDIIIEDFARKVKELSNKAFPGCKFLDAGDPAVRQKTDKGKRTTADILRALGIRVQSRPTKIEDGVNLIRSLCKPRPDGFIGFKVNDTCETMIDGFVGGYIRNDNNDPIKDGYYDHVMDAIRYLCVILFDVRTAKPIHYNGSWVTKRPTASEVTGY